MGTSLIDNFSYKGKRFLDERQSVATLAALRAVPATDIPDGFRAYCAEDRQWYEYNSSNTPDPATGKWRKTKTEVAQETGDSTDIPMSQKAVTDALTSVSEAVEQGIGSIVLKNRITSPAFDDTSAWNVENGQPFPSNDNGTLSWGDSTARVTQTVGYEPGNNIFVSLDFLVSAIPYAGSSNIIIRLMEGKTIVKTIDISPQKNGHACGIWHTASLTIEKDEIPGNVDAVTLFVSSNVATSGLHVKNPVILVSPRYVGAGDMDAVAKASKAKEIEGLQTDKICLDSFCLDNLIENGDFSNGSVGFSSQGFSLEKTDGGLSLTYNTTLGAVFSSSSRYEMCRHDKMLMYIDITAYGISDPSGEFAVEACMVQNVTRYGMGDTAYLKSGVRTRKLLVIDLSLNHVSQHAWPFLETRELGAGLGFPSASSVENPPARFVIHRIALFKNPVLPFALQIGDPDRLDSLAQSIGMSGRFSMPSASNASVVSTLAHTAENVNGFTPLLKGKKLVTLGDSITYQSTWQGYLAAHAGMAWSKEETQKGTVFINVSTGERYDTGLTYCEADGIYYDAQGEAYVSEGNIESTVIYKKVSDGTQYDTGLSHADGDKYYTDSSGEKYLLAHTSKGGITMRPTGAGHISIYEAASFARLYSPDVIILTGGTNDPASTYGTHSDGPLALSLTECAGEVQPTTVCSAVKGAIEKLSRENPKALIFLAVPVRGDYLKMGGSYTSDEEKVAAYKAARKGLEESYRLIADEYGVGFINWNTGIGITDYNLDQCFKDGVHPNDFGGWLMARAAISAIL